MICAACADRVASDAELVGKLYDKLTAAGLKVWWDKKCLKGGQKWEDGFVNGMLDSAMIVPVLSAKALAAFEKLTPGSKCDNVLLEHIMMLELVLRGETKGIFPVMVGEHMADGTYASFFACMAAITLPKVQVSAVIDKLIYHLRRAKKGVPQSRAALSATVLQVLDGLLEYQGELMAGDADVDLENVVKAVVSTIEDLRAGKAPQRRKASSRRLWRKAGLPAVLASSAGSSSSPASAPGPSTPPLTVNVQRSTAPDSSRRTSLASSPGRNVPSASSGAASSASGSSRRSGPRRLFCRSSAKGSDRSSQAAAANGSSARRPNQQLPHNMQPMVRRDGSTRPGTPQGRSPKSSKRRSGGDSPSQGQQIVFQSGQTRRNFQMGAAGSSLPDYQPERPRNAIIAMMSAQI